jgi:hypothetical protein
MVQDIICTFYDGIFFSPNITFTLRKPIFGQYTFQFVAANGQVAEAENRTGNLFIVLEFVKYGPEKKIF